ncbi:hypothetical protein DWG24_07045 [Dickeya zeae]|uniref:Uncharacterized protein n=1 Tax=Dickeya zeae TaxID=204042 RepID=A0AAE6YYG2_9GAMM|nr:hypothetical protein DWG24_07045 [Dickeya zeae]
MIVRQDDTDSIDELAILTSFPLQSDNNISTGLQPTTGFLICILIQYSNLYAGPIHQKNDFFFLCLVLAAI